MQKKAFVCLSDMENLNSLPRQICKDTCSLPKQKATNLARSLPDSHPEGSKQESEAQ